MAHPMFSQTETDVYECLKAGTVKARDTGFGKIYIHLESGLVSFHQRWKYHFTLDQTFGRGAAKAAAWADDEQRDFHSAAASIIWKFWNSRRTLPGSTDPSTQKFVDLLNKHSGISFSVKGKGEFAERFAGRQLPIEFDVLLNTKQPHYTVNVKKMLPGRDFRSFVDHAARTINLSRSDTEQSAATQEGRNPASTTEFFTLPHEFGHALGYDTDEYQAGAANRRDVKSLMNIGLEVRSRHLRLIRDQLNQMLKGVTFDLPPN